MKLKLYPICPCCNNRLRIGKLNKDVVGSTIVTCNHCGKKLKMLNKYWAMVITIIFIVLTYIPLFNLGGRFEILQLLIAPFALFIFFHILKFEPINE